MDTSIWSLLFRRSTTDGELPVVKELRALIAEFRVALLGTVRQELLSGIRQEEQFVNLRSRLRAFPDEQLTSEDYELAAEFFTRCRMQGIQGSNTDFLLCAASVRRGMPLFTADLDFELYAKQLPIQLHRVREPE